MIGASFRRYRVTRDTELKVVERSRGLSASDDNQLTLARELWLDFSHDGFTAVDSIGGRMRQGWRLDMVEPYRLLSARSCRSESPGDQGRSRGRDRN